MTTMEACAYLRPTSNSFWAWGDEGRVLLWGDDKSIAFLPEVHAAAARLAPAGLPPFAALALALAATRDAWSADESQRSTLTGYVRAALSPGAELPGLLQDLLRDALARLDAVAALPEDLRKGVEPRALLVEMLFEGVPPLIPHTATPAVLEILSQRVPILPTDDAPPANLHAAEALATIKALAGCRLLTDADAIRIRQRTGLEQLPQTPDIHISDLARGLLAKLRDDPHLSGLAKLARAILAVIATPRRLTPETDLPLGGLSDISNRGHLDRLLLTELVHDDLTLAVRVALNEALYLRRESPRSRQTFARILILDTGIRLWGLPRLFAAAVALAFAATTPKEASLTVWSPHGETLLPVDLTTREGLLAHLERLEPAPHPAPALPALAKLIQESPQESIETLIVTHPDTAADHDFQQALHSAALHPFLLATVSGRGRFVLEACSLAGRKLLSQATLSLDDIAPRSPEQPPLAAPHADLPAVFRLFASPFQLPISASVRDAVSSPRHGLIGIDRRQIVHWPAAGNPRQITSVLPNGNFLGVGLFENEGIAAAFIWDFLDKTLHLWSVDLHTCQVHAQRIADLPAEPLAVGGHAGAALVFHRGRVDTYSLRRSARLGSADFPESCRPVGARFIMRPSGAVYAVACEGSTVRLLEVTLPRSPLAVFERLGTEGPLGLYADGSVQTSLGQTLAPPAFFTNPLLRFSARVSNDGSRLIADVPGPTDTVPHGLNLSVPAPAWQPLGNTNPQHFLLGPRAEYAVNSHISLRRHMQAICVNKDGNLTLISRRGKTLVLNPDTLTFAQAGRYNGSGRHYRTFQDLPTPDGPIHGLHLATWSDGSCAWMDPRGFLHLRSSEESLPELTILLAETGPFTKMTVWASNGQTFGVPAYLSQPPTWTASELARHIRAFVGRLA